ncbi:hypothetical protein MPOCJGCO_2362 [Methylobacterium trifolii]|uniref:Uncharacterized protein n=1 Tax=Methylobacterium trifolii TaxID=1003092 RepID=A0ABQ4TYW7_9HYPH|nr:hypothetical protein MPOCJGCO_2362 [Methylobacterium trifolii]
MTSIHDAPVQDPPADRHLRPASLDALVDMNGAIKPYLNVYLYVKRDWDDGLVGLVGTVSGLAGILFQTPMGPASTGCATSASRSLPPW